MSYGSYGRYGSTPSYSASSPYSSSRYGGAGGRLGSTGSSGLGTGSYSPSDRYSRPLSTSSLSSRYGDTSSTSSSPSDRYASRSGSGSTYRDRDRDRDHETDKTTGTPCTNCKKLFDDKATQVTKLQDQVKERDLDIAELKMQVEKSQQKSDRFDTKSVDNEKREKRALERRLSELEEELKAMEQLKADNQRLKDENGALVRVISKLSK